METVILLVAASVALCDGTCAATPAHHHHTTAPGDILGAKAEMVRAQAARDEVGLRILESRAQLQKEAAAENARLREKREAYFAGKRGVQQWREAQKAADLAKSANELARNCASHDVAWPAPLRVRGADPILREVERVLSARSGPLLETEQERLSELLEALRLRLHAARDHYPPSVQNRAIGRLKQIAYLAKRRAS